PDGKRVAFTVRQASTDGERSEYLTHIHLVNADGSESRQLTQGDKSCDSPQWSPDGKLIAFLSARAGKRDLWLIRPAGGEARRAAASTGRPTASKSSSRTPAPGGPTTGRRRTSRWRTWRPATSSRW